VQFDLYVAVVPATGTRMPLLYTLHLYFDCCVDSTA
jgi:hypothetical protein